MVTEPKSGLSLWFAGARPKTLPAAVVPVAVGTAAVAEQNFVFWHLLAATVVAVALQVATNYANDYSDGVRGTDDDRVGPLRLVGSGAASASAVKWAVVASFGVAAVVGLVLSLAVTPWLLLVGAASIAAGWFYTGGSQPYGYLGLGEVFVFVFFGVVATVGSAFVQTEEFSGLALALSVPVGIWISIRLGGIQAFRFSCVQTFGLGGFQTLRIASIQAIRIRSVARVRVGL